MKFIYLAAGKNNLHLDGREDQPKCLSLFNEGKTIIDKILENLAKVGVVEKYVVGGYKILTIMEKHPKLIYFYNDQWEHTKSLYSLQRAKTEFNDDLLISYSDIVYNDQILNDLIASDSDITIGYDSKWKGRYSGRNQEIQNEAEKIFLSENNEIRVDKNIVSGRKVIGEFIGLFKIKRSLVGTLESKIDLILSKDDTASVCDLLNLLGETFTVSLIDVKGNWAELDTPQDLIRFNFGTKSETLKQLENKLKLSHILQQVKFTVEDYEARPEHLITRIQSELQSEKLVVRSSALNEDTHNSSMAGNYQSILNVVMENRSSISDAITLVIQSFLKDSQDSLPENQIFVQPQLSDVQMSGVIFTKDLETSAPYYIINYDVGDKTDSITSGIGEGNYYTYIHSKSSRTLPENKLLVKLINSVAELEEVTKHNSLDIEFAVKNDEVFILQVRPIAAHKNDVKVFESDIQKELDNIKYFINNNNIPKPKLVGDITAYGVMPDWNPAEIIGIKPYPLAFDLYKYIITDSVWSETRATLGYRNIGYHPGIYSFSGQPYVDIRMSFNTFTPKTIKDETATKLINYYIDKLRLAPEFHDKVEFEIAITSYDFDFPNKIDELKQAGFTNSELKEIEYSFFNLTKDVLQEKIVNIDDELAKTKSLNAKRAVIFESNISIPEKIAKLLEDCKQYGTKPFSILARLGFFSSILMKSLLKKGIINDSEYHGFFASMKTIASDFVEDLKALNKYPETSKAKFIETYGHLRPGTYDVISKTYRENFETYINFSYRAEKETKEKQNSFNFSETSLVSIDKELTDSGLGIDVATLLLFFKKATEARELAKFEFSKNLSLVLDYIVEFGAEMGISRSEIALCNLNDIIKVSYGSQSSNIINELYNKIKYNKKKHIITSAIKLPPLIFSPRDVDGFFYETSKPNFTTQLVIEGELVIIKDQNKEITDKIVVIENADPGFDWIFTHNIRGLITKYGGAASHMAIRCSEFGLPSAIGCGNVLFDSLKEKEIIQLDCLNQKINKF